MPIFLEKYVLPIFAAGTVLLIFTNPMKADWVQRITGGLSLLLAAFCIGYSLHKWQKPESPAPTQESSVRTTLPAQPAHSEEPRNSPTLAKHHVTPNPPTPGSVHIEQNQSPGSVIQVGDGNVAFNQDADLIRSLELHIDLDLPTTTSKVTDKMSSVGLSSIVGLFDADMNRYRFATDYQFVNWQIEPELHRFGYIYKLENSDAILNQKVGFLSHLDKLVVNYATFVRTALHTLRPEGIAIIHLKVFLNGIEVYGQDDRSPVGTIMGGLATIDVNFQSIESTYRLELAKRAGSK